MDLNLVEFAPVAQDDASGDFKTFVPENVCPKMIRYSVEEGKLTHLDFAGGCDGNLQALSTLLVDMDVEQVIEKLSGITCGRKDTSCVDQLCHALRGENG